MRTSLSKPSPDLPATGVGAGSAPSLSLPTGPFASGRLRDRAGGIALRVALVLGIWTFLGIAFASQMYLTQSKIGNPIPWEFALKRSLGDWYVFALLSWPSFWIARRFPVEGNRWVRSVLVHFVAGTLFSLSWMVLRALLQDLQSRQTEAPVSFSAAFQHALVATFFFNMMIYWVIISVSLAFQYYRRSHERELRNVELERRLTQARLQALQMQLNPHFLFNTLHAISSLMHRDVEASDRMITRLSDLLRYALENTDAQEVPLKQELMFLERYLQIEQIRFGDRLKVRQQIEPGALNAFVPNLVLQPLVENALKHGIEPRARPGEIELLAHRAGPRLHLCVRDNGQGLNPAADYVEGIGLSNTRARLQQLYGIGGFDFELRNRAGGGVEVNVSIPFHTHAGGDEPTHA